MHGDAHPRLENQFLSARMLKFAQLSAAPQFSTAAWQHHAAKASVGPLPWIQLPLCFFARGGSWEAVIVETHSGGTRAFYARVINGNPFTFIHRSCSHLFQAKFAFKLVKKIYKVLVNFLTVVEDSKLTAKSCQV